MRKNAIMICLIVAVMASIASARFGVRPLVLPENMAVLKCAMPTAAFRFLGSSEPGQIFFAHEAVKVQLSIVGQGHFSIEIQGIGTIHPNKLIKNQDGYLATCGNAPLISLVGKPTVTPIKAAFSGSKPTKVNMKLPIPNRFGTYALILIHGPERTFLGTVVRVPRPIHGGNFDNTMMLGDASFLGGGATDLYRFETYHRMGVRSCRIEASWVQRPDGTYDFSNDDELFTAARQTGIQIMVTLEGAQPWAMPFGEPTPAANWTPKTGPYSGRADWVLKPSLYPAYGKWITAFARRYWDHGKGALWGLENYNEPWEGGGISGWAEDCLHYRALQRLIATSAYRVSHQIKICAACSIMNTEDKLYSDGTNKMNKYIDVFTDHYVLPEKCYGPMVAREHGKVSMETETWFANSEFNLPQLMMPFLASGQARLAPWVPAELYDTVPGVQDDYHIPTPLVVGVAVFNHFVTGKPFQKIVFKHHLPWVFQFGSDNDRQSLLVVLGQLFPVGGDPKDVLWSQVNSDPKGTMTINNADGLLQFYDLDGNPAYLGDKSVTVPMNTLPLYIRCAKGPVVAARRLLAARISGKRPVEILPHDFTHLLKPGATLHVAVHNCLNRTIHGTMGVVPPPGFSGESPGISMNLKAGQTVVVPFTFTEVTASSGNNYPFGFHFSSNAGNADYQEVMNVCAVIHRTITMDGNLAQWKGIPSVTLISTGQKMDVAQNARKPWDILKNQSANGSYGQFKMAWDKNYLYLMARVHNPNPDLQEPRLATLNPNNYFHSAADDQIWPWKAFIAKHPGNSFGEVPYVFKQDPGPPEAYNRDRVQIGLDVTPGWHDLKSDTDRVPYGFHAVPDTDYEYSLYLCSDGKGELWRLLAPGVPRIHDALRQPRGKRTTGPVPGSKNFVKWDGATHTYIYEMAIPMTELKTLKFRPGTTFGLTLDFGAANGPSILYGENKAVDKVNGLSLHPYWTSKYSDNVRWELVQ